MATKSKKAKQEPKQSKGNAVALKLHAQALQDVQALESATADIRQSDSTMRQTVLQRAVALVRKEPTDEKGTTATIRTYLEAFDHEMRKLRGCVDKADGHTKNMKSCVASALVAVQAGKVVVNWQERGDEKPKKIATTGAEFLGAASNWQDFINKARAVKKSAGYSTVRANVKAVRAATLAGILSKLTGRMDTKAILAFVRFIGKEGEHIVLPDNKVMFEKVHAEYAGHMLKLFTETGKASDKAEHIEHQPNAKAHKEVRGNAQAAAGKPEKQRQAASLTKQRRKTRQEVARITRAAEKIQAKKEKEEKAHELLVQKVAASKRALGMEARRAA